MRSREHQRLADATPGKAGDHSVFEPHRRESVLLWRMTQGQCRQSVFVTPRVAQAIVRWELNRVAVDKKELLFVLEQRSHFANAAAGAEDLRLEREMKVASIAVGARQKSLDRLRQVVEIDDDLLDPVSDE